MSQYLLLGLGKSNMAVANDLIKQNLTFDVFLENGSVPESILESNAKVFTVIEDIALDSYQYIVKSPGIPFSHPIVEICEKKGLTITNEIGYALRYKAQPLIAITGTNGKTTSTSLIEHILNQNNQRASAVGNIGNSFLKEAKEQRKVLVTELSSFQLRDLKDLNPDVSIWLNLFSAHLDYHKTFEDYHNSKQNIFINQNPKHLFIFNEDDLHIKKASELKKGRKKSFSLKNEQAAAYFDGEHLWIEGEKWVHKNELGIKGVHNIQNAMASVLAALEYATKEEVISGLKSFNGVEHRLEKVVEDKLLKVYNDSKSTNTTAVKAALSAFEEPVVLMMGGLDRGNGYEDLVNEWSKVKSVICFGQSGPKIYRDAKDYTEAILEEDLDKAIQIAKEKVVSGGVLLFSPGCASWDRFSNFEERGKYFKEKFILHK
ncbi:UDP-N-acetylmuramoyl-L-alanine--D-glutamate ligase [Priestia megaterium]|uniref:UDP-N-acetylmuramoyl-L-alanine--D-glutamate ligase n=1 Tax=Priestia megaterium TaxID=1404 RepID=UPI002E1D6632|nr:UDP-N-acetylmuramoyl-L-alanine--D-glutamate ligase [Priestia megaterium]MED4285582.1 UDP-N-acetylmuramoyl-L-alanine--D-glutamate ligase [Priestia megaterium]